MKRIGLALGAGGARGLAHIVILEAFEELGIEPVIISGTSMGAIIGAGFAAGMSTKEMKESVDEMLFSKTSKFWELHKKSDYYKMIELIDPEIRSGGFIKGEKFIKFFSEQVKLEKFEELVIPLKIVATDFWSMEEIILQKGDLLSAVRSSYSLPGLFTPVDLNGTLLIDGGMVNPLPYDIISNDCDIIVAIDVSAQKDKNIKEKPNAYEVLFSAFQIMQNSIVREKLNLSRPDIYIKTDIKDIRTLEFLKAKSIFEQATNAKNELKVELEKYLS